jgi:Cu/Ag efflux pump CusA
MSSLKGPSAAVLKAQEKAEKIQEGQVALGDTISTAETLVKDLAQMGGITSTSKGPLANLVTSLQTGTVGQMGGRVFGTKEQAKRDELKSIRLQLLNAVKEATGMSAQQLNSNVELKTYLDSLGSEGMTKEANLAILDNLSRRYLKGESAQPAKNKSDPLGIR